MIKAIVDDITTIEADVIVNAANGLGIMGAGVAGAIRAAAGIQVQEEARGICQLNGKPIEAGKCYKTGAGDLSVNNVKYIYHAVTMQYPGGVTSLDIVAKVTKNIFIQALLDNIKSIALPALGTGIGHLDKTSVAMRMVQKAKSFQDILDITFIDKNKLFIKEITYFLEKKNNE